MAAHFCVISVTASLPNMSYALLSNVGVQGVGRRFGWISAGTLSLSPDRCDADGQDGRNCVMFRGGLFQETPEVSAMVRTWKVSTPFVMGHGVFMLCLGMALCSLGSLMTNPRVEVLGYSVAVFLTALCLLAPALIVGIGVLANGIWHRREFYIYLWVGVFSVVCWLVFWLNRLAPLDMLVLLAGLHGLFWGIWYVGLAFHLQVSPLKAGLLCVLAGITSAIGIILSTQSNLSDISAVTAVACYTSWIGIQTLLTVPYLFRNWKTSVLSLKVAYRNG